MAVTNTLPYNDVATIMVAKCFTLQGNNVHYPEKTSWNHTVEVRVTISSLMARLTNLNPFVKIKRLGKMLLLTLFCMYLYTLFGFVMALTK